MTEIQTIIHQALERFQGIRRKRAWLAGFAAFALIMGLTALLDRTWMFSGLARWSGWIAGLIAAAWAARSAAGAAMTDATTLAHQIEAEAGESASVVATAIDPAVRRSAGNEILAGILVDRLDERAAATINAAPPTFRGRLRGPCALAISAVVALLALVILQGSNGLQRMLFPWQVAPYTSLVLDGPTQPLAEGSAFTLTVQVSGVPVKTVTLHRLTSLETLAEATPDAQGNVSITVDGITSATDFVVRGGDGQSAPLRITPYLLPRIDIFEIGVTPPSYATKALKTETSPSFAVLRDSRLRYRVHLKALANSVTAEVSAAPRKDEQLDADERKNLYRGELGSVFGKENPEKKPPVRPVFRPDPENPLVWEADWPIAEIEDILYRLVIKGAHGDQIRNEDAWLINVLADTPPVVRIVSHDADEVLKLGNEKVSFKLSAVDDLQLAAARVVFRKPGQPYVRKEITLPEGTGRSWSGSELIDLAPLQMQPLDIIAVHFEAEDSNTVDGPGIGRSEVIYLQVPMPESDGADEDPAGGGGGGGEPPINPLELQMEILKGTLVLNQSSPQSDRIAIAHDQKQNMEYTMKMLGIIQQAGLLDVAAELRKAYTAMSLASRSLKQEPSEKAIPHMETALGALVEASKLLEKNADALQPPPPGEGAPPESFTLSKPKPKKPSPSKEGDEKDKKSEGEEGKSEAEKKEKVRKLMEEVQRQLTEQKKLNSSEGKDPSKAGKQQGLSEDAKAAAKAAGKIPGADGQPGAPSAAAAELEAAATLQQELADALAMGEDTSSSEKGTKSEQALSNALSELSALMDSGAYEGNANPLGYERLVGDYLRSISYE